MQEWLAVGVLDAESHNGVDNIIVVFLECFDGLLS